MAITPPRLQQRPVPSLLAATQVPQEEQNRNTCFTCDPPRKIETMAFRGTGACGEIHRKIQAGEPLTPARPRG